jgi:nucleotide sugar dehydrogenase
VTSVAVVGLGKIGLPLAALYAARGMDVIGCDIDARVVEAVNRGESPIAGEPGLAEAVAEWRQNGRLRATLDTAEAVAQSSVVVVMVRVGLDAAGHADFHYLDIAATNIGRGLRPGTLVILESNRFGRRLAGASGLPEGSFDLAYSPERVSSGTVFRDLATYPKLVGGVDEASGGKAAAFYRGVLDAPVMLLPDAETAEFAKLAESIYRDVNIALANELARAAAQLGVDYAAAARAANSQPYSHLHTPGLGVGGHCIPVYPYFLTQEVEAPLISLSREVNDSMAQHGVERLAAAMDGGLQGKRVLILGLAYRGGVKEAEFSSALLVAEALRAQGANVLVNDPLFSDAEIEARGLQPSPLPPNGPIDAAILQAGHQDYAALDFAALRGCRVLLDGRGFFRREDVEAAGLRYITIGK